VNTGPIDEAVQQMIPPAPDFDRSAWIMVTRIGPVRDPVRIRADVRRHRPRGVWAVTGSKIEQFGGTGSTGLTRVTSQPAVKAGA
jgi:hypothetical protein